MKIIRQVAKDMPNELSTAWRGIVSHTHLLRSNESPFEKTKACLVEWCRKYNVSAAGIGSPWEPVSAKHYGHYERVERDLYYAGKVDPSSVMDREELAKLFRDLNAKAGDRTYFYQDNESPKSRFGHIWYFGYNYDFPAWHDYSQDSPISYYENDPCRQINQITGKPHTRRCYMEAVASQRKAGAVCVWAHPTSWWYGPKGEFITNIASEAVLHLLADGYLDGLVVQGYDAYHKSYQAVWTYLLDTGARVPGFAETDACFDKKDLLAYDHVFMNYMRLSGKLDGSKIVSAAREAKSFASSGAFISLTAEGAVMGERIERKPGETVKLEVEAYPVPGQKKISRLDMIGRGGKILATVENFTGGTVEFEHSVESLPDYVIARSFGENDSIGARQQAVRHMAITNPIYIQGRGFEFKPVRTECKFTFSSESPWIGGSMSFETSDGTLIDRSIVRAGESKAVLPASARLRLEKDGRESRMFYIAMENEELHKHLRYLHNGEFRKDYPGLEIGEVPAEAFRLQQVKDAISSFSKSL